MALKKQSVALPFSGGIETKQDSKQVPVARALDVANATFVKATTLAKRNGYRALGKTIEGSGGATIGAVVGTAVRDGEHLVFDGKRSYSRRETVNGWSDGGELSCPTMSDVPIARTGTQQTMVTTAAAGGLTAAAWEDNRGGVWLSLADASGKIVLTDTQLDPLGQQPMCMPCGTRIVVLWAVPTSKSIMVVVVDSAAPATSFTPAVLVNDLSGTKPFYDACFASSASPNYSGDGCVIAWLVDGGLGIKIGYITSAGVLGSGVSGFPGVSLYAFAPAGGPLAIAYDRVANGFISVAYIDTSNVNNALAVVIVQASSPATQIGVVNIAMPSGTWLRMAAEIDGSFNTWVIAEVAGGSIDTGTIFSGAVSSAAVDVTATLTGAVMTARQILGHCLASRAYNDNGDVFVAIVHPVKFFPYVAVVRASATMLGARTATVARILPGESTGARARAVLPTVIATDGNAAGIGRIHAFATGVRIQLSSTNGDQFGEAGICIVTLNHNDANAYQCAQLGHGLYMAGALLQHYDGARWAEACFHCAPDSATAITPVDVGSGGSIAAGVYGYRFVYEEIDALGEIHKGPQSALVLVVVGGANHSVQIAIPCCRLTMKRNVRIGVYRSKNGDNSQFWRVTSTDPTISTGNNRYLTNQPQSQTVTFVDGIPDATLQLLEPLYTNGGILSNDPTVCAGGAIVTAKSRLFWSDPSDPNRVRFSQQLDVGNQAAMEESASLSLLVDPFGGRIVALSGLDDAIVVHKETATHIFVGPGPDADGGRTSTNGFSPSALLTSDIGCSSPRSVVQSPIGVMLHTSKGIALIGRDRQVVTQVGDPVYGFKDQGVTRATLLPDRHQILFLTGDADGSTLLYDYEHQMWARYTNHVGVDAVVVNGVYTYLRTDGRIFRETPGVYADDNQPITMLVSTAWIKLSGMLQGFQKVIEAQLLGTYKSSHQLRMRYRLDYQDAWSEPVLVNVDADYTPSLYGVGSYGTGSYGGLGVLDTVYQQRFHINRRCQSVAFEFSDVEAAGVFGAAFELSELLITGGVLGPKYPIGAARSQ